MKSPRWLRKSTVGKQLCLERVLEDRSGTLLGNKTMAPSVVKLLIPRRTRTPQINYTGGNGSGLGGRITLTNRLQRTRSSAL